MAKVLVDDISGVFVAGTLDDLNARINEIKKKIEKNLIINVYAPQTLHKRNAIKSKAQSAISKIANEGKASITEINGTLDGAIKGQWSTAVRQAVKDKSGQYDSI